MKDKIGKRVRELLEVCAEANGWRIEEINIQPDHVHLIVQFVPHVSISKMVQLFKGKSSRILRREFPELEEFYWGDNFWAEGYFAETVGICNLEKIKEYVRNQ